MEQQSDPSQLLEIYPEERGYKLARIEQSFLSNWAVPDRRPLYEWGANGHIRLPHSARSRNFSIDISPWLRTPMEWINDGITNEISVIGAVQGAKTTLAEIAYPYWLANDRAPVMWNYQSDPDAETATESRLYPILRSSPATRDIVKGMSRNEMTKGLLKVPGMYSIFQGAHSRLNLQSKSIRYLINDEAWLYPDGHLAEAYKRVTAYWNSMILNLCTGGVTGCEIHGVWLRSTQHHYHIQCPHCSEHFFPRFERPKDPEAYGGMRWDRSLKKKDGTYDIKELNPTIHLSCEKNGCEIYDTPSERRAMAEGGKYIQHNPDAPDEKKGATYNFFAVPWVPFSDVVSEFQAAMRSIRYGEERLLVELVQKRFAEFWDPERHRPVVASVTVSDTHKLQEGLKERTFRGMSIDCQHDHYWVVIRDWHKEHGSRLVHYEKVETDQECKALEEKYGIEKSRYVTIDAADRPTRVYRLALKHGWTCIRGTDRKTFVHDVEGIKIHRIWSPIQFVDPFVGQKGQGEKLVGLIYYSKMSALDRLSALRNGEVDFLWEVAMDVGKDYHSQMDAMERRTRTIPSTGRQVEEWVQVRKHDHILDCETHQIVLASICGVIGSERGEADNKEAEESPKE